FTTGGELVEGSVRQISYSAKPQTMYWYYDHLPVSGTTGVGDYVIREVKISGADPTVDGNGVVTNCGTVTAIENGGQITLKGTLKGETGRSDFAYTVLYEEGTVGSGSNVRVDTVTNDRPGIIFKKQDWSGHDLPGAVFTLKDQSGTEIGTFTSDEDGMITTAFLANNKDYTLTETSAPSGYHGLEDAMTVNVSTNGTVSVSGVEEQYYTLTQAEGTTLATLTVKNIPYTFEAIKTDETTGDVLPGVVFALHRQVTVDGTTAIDIDPMTGYESLTTDENGKIPKIDNTLPAGTYELREKTPLDGYKPIGAYTRFTVSPTGAVTLGDHPDTVTLSNIFSEDGVLKYVMTVTNIQQKKVSFKKVDITSWATSKLEGAKFDLYRADSDGESITPALYTGLTSGSDGMLSDSMGNTVFELTVGTYNLIETTAPDGYNKKADPVVVTVLPGDGTPEDDVRYDEGTGLSSSGNGRSYNSTTRVYTLKISNEAGVELPSTGGFGPALYLVLGTALIFGAGAAFIIRSRRNIRRTRR
ncbi:MAG: LPXTG cell wall anchor domain-containing protein, partial [Clostridia bacterium]|nr:LPXTG cell wall anchor domain-containing protein [Clostridia bacterium]